ncbi:2-oxoglutarate dehydrogenase subunit E1 [Arenicella chitinivorans]|uniref:2-oxoglutarate dehydrogenase E1 component n=1 Tax=Arenicella chitinivorans TaxID=1329800 RepID=A0A918VSR0_9GAMM|nr:2-oxoglutarate dehydrogenase E1 component [Arenicella chitinivorans]GHA21434.1 2-oxoglutarate dehydrogenase subunit E1 [Arenicella chitinivorans]
MSSPADPRSLLNGQNIAFLEDVYEQYQEDPNSVPTEWQQYFSSLSSMESPMATSTSSGSSLDAAMATKQGSVSRLISTYRAMGHKLAKIDPINEMEAQDASELALEYHGLSAADLDTVFDTGPLRAPDRLPLRDIVAILKANYCGSIGYEYGHMASAQQRRWLRTRLEQPVGHDPFDAKQKKHILNRLTAAEGMERYLHTKYVGQKRFSLEGGESLIPMLDHIIHQGGAEGVKEVVIGMAHRGRLNVLVNILGKAPRTLFSEFEGKHDINELAASGDVKYHQGFSSDIQTSGGPVHLSLAFNPSHLEIVSPVVVGSVRARQQRRDDHEGNTVLPISIHGDAAFAGQGVVMETFQMSECRGYRTGGTVHIVVNNQIGFTTSHPKDARSTPYCTEIAKMVGAPIFHVNGDDPEAVIFATQIALDFRMKFHKDVVIDLVCYRRHGHNESDEPSVTQPVMYKNIKALDTTRRLYAQKLIDAGVITADDEKRAIEGYRESMVAGERVVPEFVEVQQGDHTVDWTPYFNIPWDQKTDTSFNAKRLDFLAARILDIPEGFQLHARTKKIMQDRVKMRNGELALDWGMAENLAYATLLDENFAVRISGQDSGRGTFFHRHATLHNTQNKEVHVPLRNIKDKQPDFLVINSLLSEEAVLAFEYGYACSDPKTMVIWEAQFGDFANGAQVVIDQFISSGESKWGRLSGLTMFLPHGYEGQGPEHSSARLERYLQLCAQHNMQVCYPSTPAQMFHMIRRQMVRPYRKPLIVMTPKSLLRHKLSTSTMEELHSGQFQNVIPEIDKLSDDKVHRVVFCTGKVYFDLLEQRRADKIDDIAIVRVEQLYPFPRNEVITELKRYPNANEVVWCQEEPKNQGAWYQIMHHFRACVEDRHTVLYAGREASASPAAGYLAVHREQQTRLVHAALAPIDEQDTYRVEALV